MSFYGTGKRIQAAQRLTLGREDYNGWVALVLLLVWLAGITLFIPIVFGYMQSELNKVWKDPNVTDPLTPGLPHPGVAATGLAAPLPATAQPAPGVEAPQQPATTVQQPAAPAEQPAAPAEQPAAEADSPRPKRSSRRRRRPSSPRRRSPPPRRPRRPTGIPTPLARRGCATGTARPGRSTPRSSHARLTR